MPKSGRAPVGVALMAYNASETLGKALASIRPYVSQIVVGVDELSTDNTAKVARKGGADLVFPLQVSEWHECAQHGRILAQHFARARQATFAKLDRALGAWVWLDADDVVTGAERLGELVGRLQAGPAVGAWLNYHYAQIAGQTNTLFRRERVLRTSVNGQPIVWEWEHRVHETVKPANVRDAHWLMPEGIEIIHQPGGHKTGSSASRNVTLLEIDLEENPEDARAMFYLGNQYFALGDWQRAVYWYEQLGGHGQNHYELWQSWCYCSLAYEKLGNLDAATQAAFCAIDVEPRHPEPYLRLASIYLLAGKLEKVEYWTRVAREKEEPPFFVFKNPLDYSYNARMPLADALGAQGRIKEARAELEAARQVLPSEHLDQAIAHYKGLEEAEAVAQSFVTLAHGLDDQTLVRLYEQTALPDSVRQFGRVRGLVMPAYLRQPRGERRIVFWCGRSLEEWYPGTLATTGIGGSETAVVEIARRFARDGWRVDVYNGAGRHEGIYDGVGYWDPERFGQEPCDVFVSWRQPKLGPGMRTGRVNLLWCHDLNYGPDDGAFATWDKVLGVSAWHAGMLRQYYETQNVDFVPNGVDLARFPSDAKKVFGQLVYASSPDRGLLRLLELWPAILSREPGATLKVAYGWENIDKLIGAGRRDLAAFKAKVTGLLDQPGVEWLGRLGQGDLARLYAESSVWAYPTSFLEVSCISAMEAMAGGAVPVTSAGGALGETIGDAGVLVSGHPDSHAWPGFYLNCLYTTLSHPNYAKPLEYRGKERVKGLTWETAYGRWVAVVDALLAGETEEVGAR